MALAVENSASNEDGTGSSTTLDITLTITSANLLMVGAGYVEGAPTITSVVWDPAGVNEALTQLIRVREANDTGIVSELWYRKAPTAGASKTVRITLSSAGGIGGAAVGILDADQTTTFGTAVSATSPGGGSDPGTVTATTASGELLVDFFTATNASGVGANQTAHYDSNAAGRQYGLSTQAGADGGVMSWSKDGGGAQPWAIVAVPIKPTAGGGGSTPSPSAGTLALAGTGSVLGFAILMPDEL